MKENTIGDMSIDIQNDLNRAEIQTTGETGVTVICVTFRVNGENMVKVIGNFRHIDVESSVIISNGFMEIKVSVDKGNGDLIRTLPKPTITKVNDMASFITVMLDNGDSSNEIGIRINKLTQRVVLRTAEEEEVGNLTILGDRISGFISWDVADVVKLQALCVMLSVLIMGEVKLDSHFGIVGRLREKESVVGTFGHGGVGKSGTSLAELLSKAMGNKE